MGSLAPAHILLAESCQALLEAVEARHQPRALTTFMLHDNSPLYLQHAALYVEERSKPRENEA